MFNVKDLFLRSCREEDGVYNCLSLEVFNDKIKKIEIETYSVRAKNFNNGILFLSEEENSLLNPLRVLDKNAIFLELGGGNARFGFRMMKEGYTVIESDIAEGSVKKTKEIGEKNKIKNGIYAIIDAEDLPFKNECLDAVFMTASLHHLSSPLKAIKEIFRVLKKDGYLLILREPASWQYRVFFPLFYILRKILRRRDKRPISLADDLTRGFSRKKIKKMLNPFFKDIEIRPVHYLRKVYTNYLVLRSKLRKKKYLENKNIIKFLKSIDKKISLIPVINSLSWDWDIYCRRK